MPAKKKAPPKPITHISQLKPDKKNRRKHTLRNTGMIVSALHEVGAARSVVIDESGTLLAGNATHEGCAEAGITKVKVVDADGSTLIAVRRKGLTPAQKRALAIYDNRAAELAEWDQDQIREDIESGESFEGFFDQDELDLILADDETVSGGGEGGAGGDVKVCGECGRPLPKKKS